MTDVGIISYGASIPRFRIKTEEIAKTWGKDPETIKNGLGIIEKSVPSPAQPPPPIPYLLGKSVVHPVPPSGTCSEPHAVRNKTKRITNTNLE